MKKPVFTGVCTALVTPFWAGEVNYPLAELLLQRQIDAGISAVVLAGTTGEAPTLSDEEKITLFARCKAYAGNACTIIAGTGSNSTAHAIELSRAAEAVGVDALLVVSPYYNKATPEGLIAHYLSVAEAVNIPVIVYNVPSRTCTDIPVSVYQRLSLHPNIVGVKEATTDITKITAIRTACGDDFVIWSGNDDQIVPCTALGGKGVISVLSNVYPEATKKMTDSAIWGDFETASAMQCKLHPIIKALFSEVNPIPVKAAMEILGYDCGGCRLPLCDLSGEHRALLKSLLKT
ncbi:MAG: 4-hydroxy-tetrahydrodipicolinate synthase [Ruminococcaceae bacterium]|nr:4-hydroxy-tetrahydrodipicolinate synthase [Oscillospiraceae bacterium]